MHIFMATDHCTGCFEEELLDIGGFISWDQHTETDTGIWS